MISAILPVYNEETTIGKTLDCLLASSTREIEIIIVDDASTDNTAAICKQYPVILLQETVNRGPTYCRNLGVAHSRGDILLFLDADIYFPPDLLQRMIDRLESNSHLAGVLSLTSSEPLNPGYAPRFIALQDYLRYLALFNRGYRSWSYITTRFGLLKRSVFNETGGFDESLHLAAYEDLDFCGRMAERHQLALDSTFLIRHYFPPTLWQMMKRLHINVRGIMSFDRKIRQKVTAPFYQDRNARIFLGFSWLFTVNGFFLWPFWLLALCCQLAAAFQIYWFPVGFYTHKGLFFAFKGWLTYNATMLPFLTGVSCGLKDKLHTFINKNA